MFPSFSVRRLILPARLRRGFRRLFGALPSFRRRALEAERAVVEASLLFDRNWYLQKYADVARAGVDPIIHYLTAGWHEGRDPGPAFTTSAYLKANEDVARAGSNPLLHFIQYGLGEGRDGFGEGHSLPSLSREDTDLPPAHDCMSFPRRKSTRLPWRRSYRLDRRDSRYVAAGQVGVGYAPDETSREVFDKAVQLLRCVSGHGDGDLPPMGANATPNGHRLVDAWYLNMAQLRTRWHGQQLPFIVRAFQCCPWREGELELVGEGLVRNTIDFIDVHLLNPYFPILFAFSAPDGLLLGSTLLTFPSLCRGGTHYPEMLWAAAGRTRATLEAVAISNELTGKLLPLLRMEAEAAVGRIEVNGVGSAGNGPMFRADIRNWLSKVLRVEVMDMATVKPRRGAVNLAQQAPAGASSWRDGGASLVVPADVAPTVSALLAYRGAAAAQRDRRPAPLLTSRNDPCGPVMLIDVPSLSGPALNPGPELIPWVVPGTAGEVPTDFPPAAIRTSMAQELSDAQLLLPLSGDNFSAEGSRAPITWIVEPDDWQEGQLGKGLQCFALQRSAGADALALVGPSANAAVGQARDQFPGEVNVFRDEADALRQAKTPLVARVAGGVLLHDSRTADCFASLLINDRVTTASCVIVSAEKRAGVVKTVIVDGGSLLRADGDPAESADSASVAAELWQGSWPASKPSTYLWAARSRDNPFLSGAGDEDHDLRSIHLCSSAVTATTLNRRTTLNNLELPRAPDTSTRVEWLVG